MRTEESGQTLKQTAVRTQAVPGTQIAQIQDMFHLKSRLTVESPRVAFLIKTM